MFYRAAQHAGEADAVRVATAPAQAGQRVSAIALADNPTDLQDRLETAVNRLARDAPSLSARSGLSRPQRFTLVAIGVAASVLAFLEPSAGRVGLECVLALAFVAPLLVRLLAMREACAPQPQANLPQLRAGDHPAAEPIYTVLIALYREAAVVPQLIAALQSLDYPAEALDVIFAIEADDRPTRDALLAASLPVHMRIVVVPDGLPRTKPRALCYALTFAKGVYVTVYDAEDQPEPDQLRKAVAAFAAGGAKLGCLQARLNVYNRGESWLTRQFTIEYTALFDAVLPALARLGVPVPLGGTSNHFARAALERIGGWDPYNVTEDADLGVRLARFGYRVEILTSTTWEEAPPRMRDWRAQRTRWQKGWFQNYFVHMRSPTDLWRDLGPSAWLWFQLIVGGGLISALAHPWLYVLAGYYLARDGLSHPVAASFDGVVWWISVANMAATYLAAIALAIVTLRRRGFHELSLSALATPLYWLPISLAAYAALLEWMTSPFYWAKTPHRPRSRGLESQLTHAPDQGRQVR